MPQKQDMTLDVNINFSGICDGNSVSFTDVTYGQGTTNPASTGVVQSNGDIDLTKMNRNKNQFTKQTDITFHLSGTVTDPDGNDLPIFFSSPDQAVQIDGNPPSGQFTASGQNNSSDVTLGDIDNDGKTYEYCLKVEVQPDGEAPAVPGSFDPQIINRGTPPPPE